MSLLSLIYSAFLLAAYVLITLLFLAAIYAVHIVLKRRRYSHIPGPPVKSFFFGNAGELIAANRIDTHLVFVKWVQEHGALCKLLIFHKVILFACSPKLARELLTKSKYPKSEEVYVKLKTCMGVNFFGNGIATNLDFDDWKIKRQAINPAFHRSFLEKLIGDFNSASDNLISSLNGVAESGRITPILNYMHEATLEVIANVAFSFNVKKEYEPNRNFSNDLYQCMKFITEIGYDPMLLYNPLRRQYRNSTKEACLAIRRLGNRILEERLSDFKKGKEVPMDILTIMLQNLSQISTKEEMVDQMITLFIAGQETTANTLCFCLMELGRHPEYLEYVREEIDTVIGQKDFISHAELEKLDWVTAVLKETLRLYPPAGGTSREMPEDGDLDGYHIPKKTNLVISFFAIHYNYHENGSEFKPSWWLSGNAPQTDFNYMPFSLGMRSCIGKQFAYTEAKILLCKILQKFDFELDLTQRLSVEEAATQRPIDGVRVTLTKRVA